MAIKASRHEVLSSPSPSSSNCILDWIALLFPDEMKHKDLNRRKIEVSKMLSANYFDASNIKSDGSLSKSGLYFSFGFKTTNNYIKFATSWPLAAAGTKLLFQARIFLINATMTSTFWKKELISIEDNKCLLCGESGSESYEHFVYYCCIKDVLLLKKSLRLSSLIQCIAT